MAGNSLGKAFQITTFGESHGSGVGVVIDGCPAGIGLTEDDFLHEMKRRSPGRRRFDTPRKEADRVEILSGVFEHLTTGMPVTLFIRNRDVNSEPYEPLREVFRPGARGTTPIFMKYGHVDHRGGGRASAREDSRTGGRREWWPARSLEPLGAMVTG